MPQFPRDPNHLYVLSIYPNKNPTGTFSRGATTSYIAAHLGSAAAATAAFRRQQERGLHGPKGWAKKATT